MSTATLVRTGPVYDLKVADRCDRCGAQAFVVALQDSCELNLEVLLCGHHGYNCKVNGKSHVQALEEQGFTVLDFRHRLNEKPSPSASELD